MIPLRNKELVEEVVGSWPDFHDATLDELRLSRGEDGTSMLTIGVQLFDTKKYKDHTGHFVQERACFVELRFSDIALQQLQLVTFPDVLFSLRVDRLDLDASTERLLRLELQSAIEGTLVIVCAEAWVERVLQ
ncbi:hypothetical protein [Aeoliella mucimassa]|uniref:Uncharacterized protein n=1 Tax=Aeoliella mucimassa TaxID=2527972 RepID=A0A518AVC0_9BACT|nr:hypothetical protein [Aeoliella mucimassa]QDU58661.1 hypothetical protein Pan181_49000 [Aeoliella mucimassa]